MREMDNARAWIDHIQRETNQAFARISEIAKKAAQGDYEPREALADWIYFTTKTWLGWLPPPTGVAPSGNSAKERKRKR